MSAAALRCRTSHSRRRHFVPPIFVVLVCLIVTGGCRLGSPCANGPPFHGVGNETHVKVIDETTLVARRVAQSEVPLDEGGKALLAALAAWERLEARVAAGDEHVWSSDDADAYHEQVARLVRSVMRSGSIDGGAGFTVLGPEGPLQVPLVLHGFTWSAEDVNRLFTYRWSTYPKIKRRHFRAGIGAPLVAVRKRPADETNFLKLQSFAVTAILRRTGSRSDASSAEPSIVLELHNPLAARQVSVAARSLPLRGDLSAPLEYLLHVHERTNPTIAGLLRPDDADAQAQLVFVEPYHPGKIPLVFVHGLASDGATWIDTLNDLRAQPEIYERYQIWAFRYPTGRAFLGSAVELRQRLLAAREDCDPEHRDSKLDQMIMVGHSMGGLLTKLQVSASRDCLWRKVGRGPFEELEASPEVRQRLAAGLFFEPVPNIRRVVFIGTPHRGASLARRPVARLASCAVAYSPEDQAAFQRLVFDNLERLQPWVWVGQPTSIDMLSPTNPILNGVLELRIADGVRAHSIIGTKGLILDGQSDGVVDVSSARHPGVESEVYVPEGHSGLQQHSTTIAELTRILEEHWRASHDGR